jgi:hypothetical protein
VAQEPPDHAHLARLEDRPLIANDQRRIPEAATECPPLAGVESGDQKVIEVDTYADDGGDGQQDPPGVGARRQ